MKKTKIDLNEIDSARPESNVLPEPEAQKVGPEAEKPSPDAGDPKSKGSKKKFLLFGGASLLFLIGGLGAASLGWIGGPAWFSGKKSTPPVSPAASIGPMIKLAPLIINLREEGGDHYIKTTLVLEIDRKEWLEDVQSRIPSLTDMIILTLGDKKLEELRKPELREFLKKELITKGNQQFSSGKIRKIYFDEFLFQ